MENAPSTGKCERCEELERKIVALERRIDVLTKLLEESRRSGKRQAAPFRRPEGPKKNSMPPGRKPGEEYGAQQHRQPPSPEEIDETYDVPLPDACPKCHSQKIEYRETASQFQQEMPTKPIQREFRIQIGYCKDCGRRCQGRHALQTSDALGAAKVQLGSFAHATTAILNKQMGLSHGKVQAVMNHFGFDICRSTSCRSQERFAEKLEPVYQEIREEVKQSERVNADETSWRIGGVMGWVHCAVAEQAVVFIVSPDRSAQPMIDLLGIDYAGLFVHDAYRIYDVFRQATHVQCLAHPIRRCTELIETLGNSSATRMPRAAKSLFQEVIEWKKEHPEASEKKRENAVWDFSVRLGKLTDGVIRRWRNIELIKLAKYLWSRVGQWFACLLHEDAPTTNNDAEGAIRIIVVNRKVWGGNRTWAGAKRQSVLSTVIGTLLRRDENVLNFLAASLRSPSPISLPNLVPFSRRCSTIAAMVEVVSTLIGRESIHE